MRDIDWAIGGTAAVLLTGVGASLVTIVSLTWTPDLARLTDAYLDFRASDGDTGVQVDEEAVRQAQLAVLEAPEEQGLRPVRTERECREGGSDGAIPSEGADDPTSATELAEAAGVLGALAGGQNQAGLGGSTSGLGSGGHTDALGGLIGTGSIGSSKGFGGMGTLGVGRGGGGIGYGYGRGSGTFGTAGRGSSSGTFGASGSLSRSDLGPGIVGIEETSTHGGISGFVQAERDRLSTFAVDVDTGSYTLTRGLLRRGTLPRAEQVRVEEFVNAMDYDLAPPTSGRVPFAVAAEGAPHPTAANHALLRVALKGEVPAPHETANRLTFLVDTSCSMTEELRLVKHSLHTLVDHAGPEDSVAIATYAGGSRVVLRPTPITRKGSIHEAIDSLSTGGGTAMGSGMQLAYDMAREAFVDGAENRVIVLSDGDANIGATSHQQILASLREHAGRGITLSAVGFGGANYRDGLMEQLADNGDGNYIYIDGPQEAQRVFGEGLAATLTTIARDVKVQVAFDTDAVLAWRLVGYENRDVADEDFRNDAVDGGEIGAGHEVTALYEVVLADALPSRIGHVYLRAKPPGPDAAAYEWTVPIRANQLRASWGAASDDLRLASSAALLAEKLRGSPFVEEVAWSGIHDLLRPLPDTRQVVELRELVGRAEDLTRPRVEPVTNASIVPVFDDPTARSMEVVRRHMHRLRYCYQRELRADPSLRGSIEMSLHIDQGGRVVNSRMLGGSLTNPDVFACLHGQAKGIRFTPSSPHELRFTLNFQP